MAHSGISHTRRRAPRGMACVHCRQNKIRCNFGETFPDPCSKCATSGKQCSVKADFRRTRRRGRIEELERELASALGDTTHRQAQHDDDLISPAQTAISSQSQAVSSHGQETVQFPRTHSLETVQLSHLDFLELLDEFYAHYHPQLPFLGSKSTFLSDCQQTPILFWSMVNAAARSSAQYRPLRKQMAWPIRRLALSAAIKSPLPTSLGLVQALLLLCLWSPAYASQADDPSWMLCGIATHKAMQMGMHRGGFDHEYMYLPGQVVDEAVRETRRNTWLACFVVNEQLSTRHGIPPSIQPNHSIYSVATANRLTDGPPTSLRDHVRIVHKLHQISAILGNNPRSNDGLHPDPMPIVEAFDQDLTELNHERDTAWPTELRTVFLDTRLRLYLYIIFPIPSDDKANRATLVDYSRRARDVAMDIVSLLTRSVEATSSTSTVTVATAAQEEQSYPGLPWLDFTMSSLVLASCVLIHLAQPGNSLASTRLKSGADDTTHDNSALLLEGVSRASQLFRSMSIFEYDFFHRVSEVFAYMVKAHRVYAGKSLPPGRPIRSRMSANVVVQVLMQAQQRWQRDGWNRGAVQMPDGDEQRRLQAEEMPRNSVARRPEPSSTSAGADLDTSSGSASSKMPAAAFIDPEIGGLEIWNDVDFSCLLDNIFYTQSWQDSAIGDAGSGGLLS